MQIKIADWAFECRKIINDSPYVNQPLDGMVTPPIEGDLDKALEMVSYFYQKGLSAALMHDGDDILVAIDTKKYQQR